MRASGDIDIIVYLRYTINMPPSKMSHFGEKEVKLAGLAKALSHPARVQILVDLVCREFQNCGEIVGNIPLAQATVSQHLKVLRTLGLIEMTSEGPRSKYTLNWKTFDEAIEILETFLTELRNLKGAALWKSEPNRRFKQKRRGQ